MAISEELRAVIRETAREVVEQHLANCPMRELRREIYGEPGENNGAIKPTVARLKKDVEDMQRQREEEQENRRGWLQPVAIAVITAAVLWACQTLSQKAAATIHQQAQTQKP